MPRPSDPPIAKARPKRKVIIDNDDDEAGRPKKPIKKPSKRIKQIDAVSLIREDRDR